MGLEIERKFLVNKERWEALAIAEGTPYHQGYLSSDSSATVRVRTTGTKAWLTIKGPTTGASRAEFEYPIPVDEATEMLTTLCSTSLGKIRYRVTYASKLWEVDQFLDANEGLLLAEIELGSEGETVSLPEWIGEEVTGDRRYYNSYLARHPFKSWDTEQE